MLSMQVYAENWLLEVGNMIGKALKVDINTLAECHNRNMMVERGKFTRVSVEVDLNQAPKSRGESAREIYARGNSRNVSENHMCCHAQIKPLEVEDHIFSKCVDLHRKMEVSMTVWRRKEVEALLSNKEGVVGDKERENLNIDKGEKGIMLLGESHIKSSTDREKKEKGKIVKEKEGKEQADREKKKYEEEKRMPCNQEIVISCRNNRSPNYQDLNVMARNASHNKELNDQCYVAQHVKSNDVDDGEEDLEVVSSSL
ncbi:hypothetical protein K1719_039428 [Acacia pycnantha]|nr:hypothetical protein K1719_039428 [Acacia pycnantha]